MTMPTDPLAGGGGDRRAGETPPRKASPPKPYTGPERRDPTPKAYPGPERRRPADPGRLLGLPRWLVLTGAAYLLALVLALLLVFSY